MKLLVTGARGQVGRALVNRASSAFDVVGLDRESLDIADKDAVVRAVEEHRPDIVVNAAAYTAVDRAEEESGLAFQINRDGAEHIGLACAEIDIPLIHVSTDYVFDGLKTGPYTEDDPPNPLGVYGSSKWAGEEVVRSLAGRHVIVRTSWVFSPHGTNFVRTMLNLIRERDELRVVSDQHGCPTSAYSIADALIAIARNLVGGKENWGTFHFAGQPATTWFSFAQAIVEEAEARGISRVKNVVPITTKEYPTAARRPPNSVLATKKIQSAFGIAAPDWRPELAATISAILAALPVTD